MKKIAVFILLLTGALVYAHPHHYFPHRDLYVAMDVASFITDLLLPRTVEIHQPTTYVVPTTTYVVPTVKETTYIAPTVQETTYVAPTVVSQPVVTQPVVTTSVVTQPIVVTSTPRIIYTTPRFYGPRYGRPIPRFMPPPLPRHHDFRGGPHRFGGPHHFHGPRH